MFAENGFSLISVEGSTPSIAHDGVKSKPYHFLPPYPIEHLPVKVLGIVDGQERTLLFNPYFFGFVISYNIYTHCFHMLEDFDLEDKFVEILVKKFGEDFKQLYDFVAYHCYTALTEALELNDGKDTKDVNFTSRILGVSGLTNLDIFFSFIHHPNMVSINRFKQLVPGLPMDSIKRPAIAKD